MTQRKAQVVLPAHLRVPVLWHGLIFALKSTGIGSWEFSGIVGAQLRLEELLHSSNKRTRDPMWDVGGEYKEEEKDEAAYFASRPGPIRQLPAGRSLTILLLLIVS
ncbi:hypothetical protein Pelo_4074 [Pelomyxa schiedti]|nr:hypothetical protein Pelo_4074 [Pelomyxa schiedti]